MIQVIADLTIAFCLLVLFTAIIINFSEPSAKAKKEKKSIVETGTMILFFIGFYLLIRFRIGSVDLGISWLVAPGLLMVVAGCIINVTARFNLGRNWANPIKIYEGQVIVKTGWYSVVRHPLYASLIMMFYGACLVYPNYLAFIANTFIFIPFMHYRAKQEEAMLEKTFEGYRAYKKEVGMFFPKIR